MDPLSIITAVASISKTAISVSTTLYTFVNQTRNIDQNVKSLATEVEALSSALQEVEAVLQSPTVVAAEKRASADDNKQLWHTVYGTLEECQVTIVKIDSALDAVRKKHSNWAAQTFRQIKLNLGKDEIHFLRTQTQTHCSALKMALQIVNIRAAYMAPVVVIDDLGPKIESLQGSLDLLTTSLEDQRREIARMSGKRTNVNAANTEQLRLLARRILYTATSVHGSTVAGGSVHGDPAANETRIRTMNWIPEPVVNERALSRSSLAQSRGDRAVLSESDSKSGTDLTEESTKYDEPDLTERDDSDGEFEFEVTQRLLEKGTKSFSSANYKEAVGFLQKGVASSNRLPISQRTKLDLADVPMMIATCKYHLQELEEAKDDLLILVRQESESDQDAIRICQMSHILSQICLIQNQLDASEDYCRKSLKGRQRLLGREHKDYFSSLGLLSEICDARGKDEEASVYQEMIPPEIAKLQKKTGTEVNRPKETALNTKKSDTDRGKLQTPGPTLEDHSSHVEAIAFSPKSIRSNDTTIRLWDKLTGKTEAILRGHRGTVISVAFSPDGKLLATGSYDMTARLWDTATGVMQATLGGHSNLVRSVAFSPDGKLFATGSSDSNARLWGIVTGATPATRAILRGHKDTVTSVAFSPDGKLLATGSYDKTVMLWNTATGATRATLQGHSAIVEAIAFSPDGKLLATGSRDKTAKLWETASGASRATLQGHSDTVAAIAFSPDGKLLATGSYDKTAKLWNIATGATRATLQGHSALVDAIAFSPNGKLLATGSYDKTVMLWRTATGTIQASLQRHVRPVTAVAFSPDGKLLATGSLDRTARLWDMGRHAI